MQYGRAWSESRRTNPAVIVEDTTNSPLESLPRGTYIRIHFSNNTRPKSLSHLATSFQTWETILRTRTAIGQILLECEAVTKLDIKLRVIGQDGTFLGAIEPEFLYPHRVKRTPVFRFLNLTEYYQGHQETSTPPRTMLRQDGIYIFWGTDKVKHELGTDLVTKFEVELDEYQPCIYAFVPYAATIWTDINYLATGVRNRSYQSPGLIIGVNRQRLADIFDINPSRFQFLGLNSLVVVHFENAKPDYGRKTVQEEVLDLARQIANRAVLYMADQRVFLRDPGEAPTEGQRETEKDHEEWLFNVKDHSKKSPIHQPPITYISTPLTEQDVVGLFNQLSALGVFPGIQIFATSQTKTYDCLVSFECDVETRGICYTAEDQNPLGLSARVLGKKQFTTRSLTLEFKNNLDGLTANFADSNSRKSFSHIDLCVCWSHINPTFKGYELEEITGSNFEERKFPGVTHLLRKDGDTHVIQVIMLKKVLQLIESGSVQLSD
jgi:hypothetical protein